MNKINFMNQLLTGITIAISLYGCSNTTAFLPASGPSSSTIVNSKTSKNIQVVDITSQNFTQYNLTSDRLYNQSFWYRSKPVLKLGAGDVIQISMWEAPPAVLFGSTGISSGDAIGLSGGVLNLPEQIVSAQGYIVVPFVGSVQTQGKTLADIESLIKNKLSKIANKPQVIARLVQNNTNTVSLIADGRSFTIPLTPKGERLIDLVAKVGEIKKVKSMSFAVIRGQNQISVRASDLSDKDMYNIYLYPGDTVRVLQEQYDVSVLGAANVNTVLSFGDNGLTVADAIAKTAGINDYKANAKGIFIFRKSTTLLNDDEQSKIYRFDLTTSEGVMVAQKFNLKDKDILYISNASGAELQKFLSIIGSALNPVAATKNIAQ